MLLPVCRVGMAVVFFAFFVVITICLIILELQGKVISSISNQIEHTYGVFGAGRLWYSSLNYGHCDLSASYFFTQNNCVKF